MNHPNLYNDNIVSQSTNKHGTHIHIDNGVMGHAIIRTHGPDGELLAGEKNTADPRRDVIATGKPQYISKMFKTIHESVVEDFEQDEITGEVTRKKDYSNSADKANKKSKEDDKWYVGSQKNKKSDCNEELEIVKAMLESIYTGELVESTDTFSNILVDKIALKLEEARMLVAKNMFGESKADDLWNSTEPKKEKNIDLKSDETSEEEESKHPLMQLKKIASYTKNTPEEHLVYNDKHVIGHDEHGNEINSLNKNSPVNKKYTATGETSHLQPFSHKNGEKSNIEPAHAQHIVNVLTGSAVKPDTKKAVLDTIHGSKAGLEKIKSAIGTGVVKNKSIYGDDSRT
jgi:hypothetical protein